MNLRTISALSVLLAAGSQGLAGERDVQFISIDSEAGIITLMNTGSEVVDLSGWRFCTQNTSQVRRYSSSVAFLGMSIASQDTLSLHLNNDADAGDPNQINLSAIGTFANFELEAFGLSFYFPNKSGFTPFSDGNFIADHLQWSIDGIDNDTADERSDEAENGGVWTDQSAWISVTSETTMIELDDSSFGQLHGPSDYIVHEVCVADIDGNGELNFFDVGDFLVAYAAENSVADINSDGLFNFFDVGDFLVAFGAGCP